MPINKQRAAAATSAAIYAIYTMAALAKEASDRKKWWWEITYKLLEWVLKEANMALKRLALDDKSLSKLEQKIPSSVRGMNSRKGFYGFKRGFHWMMSISASYSSLSKLVQSKPQVIKCPRQLEISNFYILSIYIFFVDRCYDIYYRYISL
jgi:hypothetical protein